MKILLIIFCLSCLGFLGCGVKGDPKPYVEQAEKPRK